ncbi:MAG: hypothetical protein AAGK37_20820 [Pseudomonadota bacterium]
MIDLIGLAAGIFVILAFYARTPRWLRRFAIVSNVLFMAYASEMRLWPIFVLHAILLPLNVLRLAEETAVTRQDPNLPMTDAERDMLIQQLNLNGHRWSCY